MKSPYIPRVDMSIGAKEYITVKAAAAGNAAAASFWGLERREVEKRLHLAIHWGVYNLYALIISAGFEHAVTQMKTNLDEFVNMVSKAVVD